LECISHFLLKCEAQTPRVPVKKPSDKHSRDETLAERSLATPKYMPFIYMYMQEIELGSTVL